MNTYTLESFINFCDDMQIVEEAINFKSVMSMVSRAINQIISFIRSIPSRVSAFISKKFKGNTDSAEYKKSVEKSKTLMEQINDATDKLNECNAKMKQMQNQNDENMSKLDQLQKQAESIAQSVINSTKSIDPSFQSEMQTYFDKSYKTV